MSLYTDCVEAGIPTHNHYSDLYIPVTPITRVLLKKHKITTATCFINQVEGHYWFDVPFAYEPFWDKVQRLSGKA